MNMGYTASTTTSTIVATSMKLPPFLLVDPEVRFAQVPRLSLSKRHGLTISSVPWVLGLPWKSKIFSWSHPLKALMILSRHKNKRKLQQLISGEELGDRKPTQLLRHIQHLLGDKLCTSTDANSFLHELTLQRLTPKVRMVLASVDSSVDLDKLSHMADKVMELAAPMVAAITDTHLDYRYNSEVKLLREEVADLADIVAFLITWSCYLISSKPRHITSPDMTNPIQDWLCLYHAKLREAPQKCMAPCNVEISRLDTSSHRCYWP